MFGRQSRFLGVVSLAVLLAGPFAGASGQAFAEPGLESSLCPGPAGSGGLAQGRDGSGAGSGGESPDSPGGEAAGSPEGLSPAGGGASISAPGGCADSVFAFDVSGSGAFPPPPPAAGSGVFSLGGSGVPPLGLSSSSGPSGSFRFSSPEEGASGYNDPVTLTLPADASTDVSIEATGDKVITFALAQGTTTGRHTGAFNFSAASGSRNTTFIIPAGVEMGSRLVGGTYNSPNHATGTLTMRGAGDIFACVDLTAFQCGDAYIIFGDGDDVIGNPDANAVDANDNSLTIKSRINLGGGNNWVKIKAFEQVNDPNESLTAGGGNDTVEILGLTNRSVNLGGGNNVFRAEGFSGGNSYSGGAGQDLVVLTPRTRNYSVNSINMGSTARNRFMIAGSQATTPKTVSLNITTTTGSFDDLWICGEGVTGSSAEAAACAADSSAADYTFEVVLDATGTGGQDFEKIRIVGEESSRRSELTVKGAVTLQTYTVGESVAELENFMLKSDGTAGDSLTFDGPIAIKQPTFISAADRTTSGGAIFELDFEYYGGANTSSRADKLVFNAGATNVAGRSGLTTKPIILINQFGSNPGSTGSTYVTIAEINASSSIDGVLVWDTARDMLVDVGEGIFLDSNTEYWELVRPSTPQLKYAAGNAAHYVKTVSAADGDIDNSSAANIYSSRLSTLVPSSLTGGAWTGDYTAHSTYGGYLIIGAGLSATGTLSFSGGIDRIRRSLSGTGLATVGGATGDAIDLEGGNDRIGGHSVSSPDSLLAFPRGVDLGAGRNIMRAASAGSAGVTTAILAEDGNDIVELSGDAVGAVNLGGGNNFFSAQTLVGAYTGGAGNDTIVLTPDAAFTLGTLNAGAGTNKLFLSGMAGSPASRRVSVDLSGGPSTGAASDTVWICSEGANSGSTGCGTASGGNHAFNVALSGASSWETINVSNEASTERSLLEIGDTVTLDTARLNNMTIESDGAVGDTLTIGGPVRIQAYTVSGTTAMGTLFELDFDAAASSGAGAADLLAFGATSTLESGSVATAVISLQAVGAGEASAGATVDIATVASGSGITGIQLWDAAAGSVGSSAVLNGQKWDLSSSSGTYTLTLGITWDPVPVTAADQDITRTSADTQGFSATFASTVTAWSGDITVPAADTHPDIVTLTAGMSASGAWDLGGGANRIRRALDGTGVATVSGEVTLGGGGDIIGGEAFANPASQLAMTGPVNLGGGANIMRVASAGSSTLASGKIAITGGSGADTVEVAGAVVGGVNLGNGTNVFSTGSLSGGYTGGAGSDTISISGAATGNIQLGNSSSVNTLTIGGTYGGASGTTSTDTITITSVVLTQQQHITIGGGAGNVTVLDGIASNLTVTDDWSGSYTAGDNGMGDNVTLQRGKTFSGSITMHDGTNQLSASAAGTGVATVSGDVTGGDDTDLLGGTDGVGNFHEILFTGAVNLGGGSNSIRARGVSSYTGGSADDTLILTPSSNFTLGTLDVGGGTNWLFIVGSTGDPSSRRASLNLGGTATGTDTVHLCNEALNGGGTACGTVITGGNYAFNVVLNGTSSWESIHVFNEASTERSLLEIGDTITLGTAKLNTMTIKSDGSAGDVVTFGGEIAVQAYSTSGTTDSGTLFELDLDPDASSGAGAADQIVFNATATEISGETGLTDMASVRIVASSGVASEGSVVTIARVNSSSSISGIRIWDGSLATPAHVSSGGAITLNRQSWTFGSGTADGEGYTPWTLTAGEIPGLAVDVTSATGAVNSTTHPASGGYDLAIAGGGTWAGAFTANTGSHKDTATIAAGMTATGLWDFKDGADAIKRAADGTGNATISGQVLMGGGNDRVGGLLESEYTSSTTQTQKDAAAAESMLDMGSVYMGAGDNKLRAASVTITPGTGILYAIEGQGGSDIIEVAGAITGRIDLQGGSNSVKAGSINGVISTGDNSDTIEVSGALTSTSVSLGNGTNMLTAQSMTVSGNTAGSSTAQGGSGNDTFILERGLSADSIQLGGGTNILQAGFMEAEYDGESGEHTDIIIVKPPASAPRESNVAEITPYGGTNRLFLVGNTGDPASRRVSLDLSNKGVGDSAYNDGTIYTSDTLHICNEAVATGNAGCGTATGGNYAFNVSLDIADTVRSNRWPGIHVSNETSTARSLLQVSADVTLASAKLRKLTLKSDGSAGDVVTFGGEIAVEAYSVSGATDSGTLFELDMNLTANSGAGVADRIEFNSSATDISGETGLTDMASVRIVASRGASTEGSVVTIARVHSGSSINGVRVWDDSLATPAHVSSGGSVSLNGQTWTLGSGTADANGFTPWTLTAGESPFLTVNVTSATDAVNPTANPHAHGYVLSIAGGGTWTGAFTANTGNHEDTITIAAGMEASGAWSLGAGRNEIKRATAGTTDATISGRVTMGDGDDVIGGSAAAAGESMLAMTGGVDLGGGANVMRVSSAGAADLDSSVKAIAGGAGNDTVEVAGSVMGGVDLGGGTNEFTAASLTGGYTGGDGNDTITLALDGSAFNPGALNPGGGTNKLFVNGVARQNPGRVVLDLSRGLAVGSPSDTLWICAYGSTSTGCLGKGSAAGSSFNVALTTPNVRSNTWETIHVSNLRADSSAWRSLLEIRDDMNLAFADLGHLTLKADGEVGDTVTFSGPVNFLEYSTPASGPFGTILELDLDIGSGTADQLVFGPNVTLGPGSASTATVSMDWPDDGVAPSDTEVRIGRIHSNSGITALALSSGSSTISVNGQFWRLSAGAEADSYTPWILAPAFTRVAVTSSTGNVDGVTDPPTKPYHLLISGGGTWTGTFTAMAGEHDDIVTIAAGMTATGAWGLDGGANTIRRAEDGATDATISGRVTLGAGGDTIGGATAAAPQSMLAMTGGVDLGDGDNVMRVSSAGSASLAPGTLAIVGGAEKDTVEVAGSVMGGVDLGDGENRLAAESLTGGYTGGSGDDFITLRPDSTFSTGALNPGRGKTEMFVIGRRGDPASRRATLDLGGNTGGSQVNTDHQIYICNEAATDTGCVGNAGGHAFDVAITSASTGEGDTNFNSWGYLRVGNKPSDQRSFLEAGTDAIFWTAELRNMTIRSDGTVPAKRYGTHGQQLTFFIEKAFTPYTAADGATPESGTLFELDLDPAGNNGAGTSDRLKFDPTLNNMSGASGSTATVMIKPIPGSGSAAPGTDVTIAEANSFSGNPPITGLILVGASSQEPVDATTTATITLTNQTWTFSASDTVSGNAVTRYWILTAGDLLLKRLEIASDTPSVQAPDPAEGYDAAISGGGTWEGAFTAASGNFADLVTIEAGMAATGTWNLGGGSNVVKRAAAGTGIATISGEVTALGGDDRIGGLLESEYGANTPQQDKDTAAAESMLAMGNVNLGEGSNKMRVASAGNITALGGADAIEVVGAAGVVNLGHGENRLKAGAITRYIGGNNSDTVEVSGAIAESVTLGGRPGAVNRLTAQSVGGFVAGSQGSDTVIVEGVIGGDYLAGSGGPDILEAEWVMGAVRGGDGDDTVTLRPGASAPARLEFGGTSKLDLAGGTNKVFLLGYPGSPASRQMTVDLSQATTTGSPSNTIWICGEAKSADDSGCAAAAPGAGGGHAFNVVLNVAASRALNGNAWGAIHISNEPSGERSFFQAGAEIENLPGGLTLATAKLNKLTVTADGAAGDVIRLGGGIAIQEYSASRGADSGTLFELDFNPVGNSGEGASDQLVFTDAATSIDGATGLTDKASVRIAAAAGESDQGASVTIARLHRDSSIKEIRIWEAALATPAHVSDGGTLLVGDRLWTLAKGDADADGFTPWTITAGVAAAIDLPAITLPAGADTSIDRADQPNGGRLAVSGPGTWTGSFTAPAISVPDSIAIAGGTAAAGIWNLGNGVNTITRAAGGSGNATISGTVTLGKDPDTIGGAAVGDTESMIAMVGAVTLGDGSNTMRVASSGDPGSSLINVITGGADNDTVEVAGAISGNVDLGAGDNTLMAASLTGSYQGGAGSDTVTISGDAVGAFRLGGGAGGNTLRVEGALGSTVTSEASLAADMVEIGGGAGDVNLGGGKNSLKITAGAWTGGYVDGAGADTIEAARGAAVGAESGAPTLELTSGANSVRGAGTFNSAVTFGGGDDIIGIHPLGESRDPSDTDSHPTPAELAAQNSLAMAGGVDLGGGSNEMRVASVGRAGARGTAITGGSESDFVEVFGAIHGAVALGDGTNTLVAERLTGGYTGGSGADTVVLSPAVQGPGDLALGTMNLGTGENKLLIGGRAGGAQGGKTILHLDGGPTAGAGSDTLTICGNAGQNPLTSAWECVGESDGDYAFNVALRLFSGTGRVTWETISVSKQASAQRSFIEAGTSVTLARAVLDRVTIRADGAAGDTVTLGGEIAVQEYAAATDSGTLFELDLNPLENNERGAADTLVFTAGSTAIAGAPSPASMASVRIVAGFGISDESSKVTIAEISEGSSIDGVRIWDASRDTPAFVSETETIALNGQSWTLGKETDSNDSSVTLWTLTAGPLDFELVDVITAQSPDEDRSAATIGSLARIARGGEWRGNFTAPDGDYPDTLVIEAGMTASGEWSLGGGMDSIRREVLGTGVATVSGVVTLGAGNDRVGGDALSDPESMLAMTGRVDLGDGTNTMRVQSVGDPGAPAQQEPVIAGGDGNDTVEVAGVISGGVDLGGGENTLEAKALTGGYTGGGGSDTITLMPEASVDLGAIAPGGGENALLLVGREGDPSGRKITLDLGGGAAGSRDTLHICAAGAAGGECLDAGDAGSGAFSVALAARGAQGNTWETVNVYNGSSGERSVLETAADIVFGTARLNRLTLKADGAAGHTATFGGEIAIQAYDASGASPAGTLFELDFSPEANSGSGRADTLEFTQGARRVPRQDVVADVQIMAGGGVSLMGRAVTIARIHTGSDVRGIRIWDASRDDGPGFVSIGGTITVNSQRWTLGQGVADAGGFRPWTLTSDSLPADEVSVTAATADLNRASDQAGSRVTISLSDAGSSWEGSFTAAPGNYNDAITIAAGMTASGEWILDGGMNSIMRAAQGSGNATISGTVTLGDGSDTIGGEAVSDPESMLDMPGAVNLGGGTNKMRVASAGDPGSPQAVAITGGGGSDTVEVAGVISGSVDLGGGENMLSATSLTGSYTGGSGNDTITLRPEASVALGAMGVGQGVNTLFLLGRAGDPAGREVTLDIGAGLSQGGDDDILYICSEGSGSSGCEDGPAEDHAFSVALGIQGSGGSAWEAIIVSNEPSGERSVLEAGGDITLARAKLNNMTVKADGSAGDTITLAGEIAIQAYDASGARPAGTLFELDVDPEARGRNGEADMLVFTAGATAIAGPRVDAPVRLVPASAGTSFGGAVITIARIHQSSSVGGIQLLGADANGAIALNDQVWEIGRGEAENGFTPWTLTAAIRLQSIALTASSPSRDLGADQDPVRLPAMVTISGGGTWSGSLTALAGNYGDRITIAAGMTATGEWRLRDGANSVMRAPGAGAATISGRVTMGAHNDTIGGSTASAPESMLVMGGGVSLGGGDNVMRALSAGGEGISGRAIEAGDGNDTIEVSGAVTGGVSLGAGENSLTAGSLSGGYAGGDGNDTIILTPSASGALGAVNPGAGENRMFLVGRAGNPGGREVTVDLGAAEGPTDTLWICSEGANDSGCGTQTGSAYAFNVVLDAAGAGANTWEHIHVHNESSSARSFLEAGTSIGLRTSKLNNMTVRSNGVAGDVISLDGQVAIEAYTVSGTRESGTLFELDLDPSPGGGAASADLLVFSAEAASIPGSGSVDTAYVKINPIGDGTATEGSEVRIMSFHGDSSVRSVIVLGQALDPVTEIRKISMNGQDWTIRLAPEGGAYTLTAGAVPTLDLTWTDAASAASGLIDQMPVDAIPASAPEARVGVSQSASLGDPSFFVWNSVESGKERQILARERGEEYENTFEILTAGIGFLGQELAGLRVSHFITLRSGSFESNRKLKTSMSGYGYTARLATEGGAYLSLSAASASLSSEKTSRGLKGSFDLEGRIFGAEVGREIQINQNMAMTVMGGVTSSSADDVTLVNGDRLTGFRKTTVDLGVKLGRSGLAWGPGLFGAARLSHDTSSELKFKRLDSEAVSIDSSKNWIQLSSGLDWGFSGGRLYLEGLAEQATGGASASRQSVELGLDLSW